MDKKKAMNDRSKDRLRKEISKRINTTMIGAIASIEKYFGKMWGFENQDVTPQQERLREVFEELRSEILDKGNAQIRNIESELSSYDVVWNRFHIDLPIKRN